MRHATPRRATPPPQDASSAFKLISAVPSIPQDPSAFAGTTGVAASLLDGTPGRIVLPPRECVDVTVRFRAPKTDHRGDYRLLGNLIAAFTNGETQALPLTADVLHPELQLRPPGPLRFGRVHTQSPKPLEVTLINPTGVDAAWAVTTATAAAGGAKPHYPKLGDAAAAGAAAMSEARLGPWVVRPGSGVLPGRGLGMPRTVKVTVTFAPADGSAQEEQLVFAVHRGRQVALQVEGEGSFDERDEHQGHLFRI